MKVLITGANGFVGKNLQLHLAERKDVQVVCFTRADDMARLPALLSSLMRRLKFAAPSKPFPPTFQASKFASIFRKRQRSRSI